MMENKVVVLSDLVAQLAEKTGTSETLCEAFLKELLSYSSENLIEGKSLQIPGIGVFEVNNGDICFSIDSGLDSCLNSAFECFEVIELDDGIPDNIFEEKEESVSTLVETTPEPEEPDVKEIEETSETKVEEEILLPPPIPEEDKIIKEEKPATEQQQEEIVAQEEPKSAIVAEETERIEVVSIVEEKSEETEKEESADYVYDDEVEEPRRRCVPAFVYGFISGICLSAIVAVALFYMGKVEVVSNKAAVAVLETSMSKYVVDSLSAPKVNEISDSGEVKLESKSVAKAEQSVAQKEEESSVVTCKVTKTTYLCSMSRKYYGHYAFWVYIYLENKSIIKDPNNIAIGTTLVIPPADKYGIDKNDPASIAKADALAAEILAKN